MGCSHRLVVVAYMMAIKFIHANLRLIIDVTEEQEQEQKEEDEQENQRRSSLDAHVFSRLSTERSTLKKSPSPMVSPPASPKSQCSQPEKSQDQQQQQHQQRQENDASKSQRALQALRMEIEFLHFLNYDLTVSDPVGLVEWAHRPSTKGQQQQMVDEPSPAPTATSYSSANEGDDELESDDALSLV